jgi:hypothetical protein
VVEVFSHSQAVYIIPGFYGRNVEARFYVLETKSSAGQMDYVYGILL